MLKINTMLNSALLGGLLALSASSFNVQADVLLQNWNGSGNSGFGSLALQPNDDGSTQAIAFDDFEQLNFDSGINFFGTVQNQFFINNNGNITFNRALGGYTPVAFPVASQPMIAPFWGDVDTSCVDCGEVFIGSPNANTIVVTWSDVAYYGSGGFSEGGDGGDFGEGGDFFESDIPAQFDAEVAPNRNTFQLVLIDRSDTGAGNFDVEFRYEDINWTTGTASGGDSNGLGGTPAQAGYDAGDGVNFFVVPGSQTAGVVDLDTAPSNTGTAGIWKFAVRDGELPGDTAENPILPITDPNNPGDYSFEFAVTDNDPIFIDPDVAIGYDYIVNSGPNLASVLLPENIGDNLFDLWLWDFNASAWYDTDTDITGGIWYNFAQPTDRFRIMGIEIDEMLDPSDSMAFVTGLTFDSQGIVNMNQTAVTTFVTDPTSVPEPETLLLFITAFGFMVRKRFRLNK
jgi:hypothetical protein